MGVKPKSEGVGFHQPLLVLWAGHDFLPAARPPAPGLCLALVTAPSSCLCRACVPHPHPHPRKLVLFKLPTISTVLLVSLWNLVDTPSSAGIWTQWPGSLGGLGHHDILVTALFSSSSLIRINLIRIRKDKGCRRHLTSPSTQLIHSS